MKRISIVEDNQAILDSLRIVFETMNLQVSTYANAEMFMGTAHGDTHLFVIDRQLPGIDGLELCKFLKSAESTRNIPVIMISASPAIKAFAKDAGADAVIEKPFNLRTLRKVIKEFI